MNTTSNFISKLQNIITQPVLTVRLSLTVSKGFQMWRAAFLLRKDYNDPSMQEFIALDTDDFLDHS